MYERLEDAGTHEAMDSAHYLPGFPPPPGRDGRFADGLVPVGHVVSTRASGRPRPPIRGRRLAFSKDGSVTAGDASRNSDGAVALGHAIDTLVGRSLEPGSRSPSVSPSSRVDGSRRAPGVCNRVRDSDTRRVG
jgi:hypothetical protein